VPENLALKRKVLTELDAAAPKDTIIASNSSSYGISEIIEGLMLRYKQRVLSAHCCEYCRTEPSHANQNVPRLASRNNGCVSNNLKTIFADVW
jgi:3-hydroxyacyl-CoA dehydrogenase, NAD binding domain